VEFLKTLLPADALEPILLVLLTCCVFGALGGLSAHFLRSAHGRVDAQITVAVSGWAQSLVIGACGALAFMAFTVAAGGLSATELLPTDILRTIGVSIIVGFGGRRLLPRMVDHLEKQVAEADKKAEHAEAGVQSIKKKNSELDALVKGLTEALQQSQDEVRDARRTSEQLVTNYNLKDSASNEATRERREAALKRAEALIKDNNANSATWVAMARVYRWGGDLGTAIDTLDRAEAAMRCDAVDHRNKDVLLYNRALYRAMSGGLENSADKRHIIRDLDDFFGPYMTGSMKRKSCFTILTGSLTKAMQR